MISKETIDQLRSLYAEAFRRLRSLGKERREIVESALQKRDQQQIGETKKSLGL